MRILKYAVYFIHERLPHKRHVIKIKQNHFKLFKPLQNPARLRTGNVNTARSIKFYPYLGLVESVVAVIVDVGIFFENIMQVAIGICFNLKDNPRAPLDDGRMARGNVMRKIVNDEHLAKTI